MILICALCWLPNKLPAEDVVIARSKTTSKTVKRKGIIVDWTGGSLTISSNGNERLVENELIVQVQTNWNENYLEGRKLLAKFQFEDTRR